MSESTDEEDHDALSSPSVGHKPADHPPRNIVLLTTTTTTTAATAATTPPTTPTPTTTRSTSDSIDDNTHFEDDTDTLSVNSGMTSEHQHRLDQIQERIRSERNRMQERLRVMKSQRQLRQQQQQQQEEQQRQQQQQLRQQQQQERERRQQEEQRQQQQQQQQAAGSESTEERSRSTSDKKRNVVEDLQLELEAKANEIARLESLLEQLSPSSASAAVVELEKKKKTRGTKKKSRFVRQLEANLQDYDPSSSNNNSLDLSFAGCVITYEDVWALQSNVPADHEALVDLSLECCRLANSYAARALQDFVSCHAVQSLGFSVADITPSQMTRLIRDAHHLQSLELTLRQHNTTISNTPPDSYSEHDTKNKKKSKNKNNTHSFIAPVLEHCVATLKTLKLNALFPFSSSSSNNNNKTNERVVPISLLEELVTALVPARQLQSFQFTHATLHDEGLAVLMGGLLAVSLRSTLQHLHIQITGTGWDYDTDSSVLTSQSLTVCSLCITEFPVLEVLNLQVADCPHFLPSDTEHDDWKSFSKALQNTMVKHISLHWTHVGWNEDTVLFVLQTAATMEKQQQPTPQLSLHMVDFNWIQNERFIYQLATYLPQLKFVTELTVVNETDMMIHDDDDNKNDISCSNYDWWNLTKQELMVEALHANTTLQRFDLQLGRGAQFSPHYADVVRALLARNNNNNSNNLRRPAATSAAAAMQLQWMDQRAQQAKQELQRKLQQKQQQQEETF